MNKFKYYFILMIGVVSLFSCSKKKEDEIIVTPPRDYAVQYAADIADIETYLKSYYITVVDHAGFPDDQDVSITKITDAPNQPSIYSYLNATTFPKLLSREVELHDITYKLYYLVLREGVGQSPSNVDAVLTSYKGDYLSSKTEGTVTTLSATFFEQFNYPQIFYSLYTKQEVPIRAWSEIFPQFKTGNHSAHLVNDVPDGTVDYTDFGAGVMFIPSGLGYFSTGSTKIPAYAPLVFSFKLYEIQRLDQDGDGILSYLEDLNGDNYMRVLKSGVPNPDDTDGDGIPNFLDDDDDGDNFSTKIEIKNPATGLAYPFAEIPTCASGKKNFLDASCHP